MRYVKRIAAGAVLVAALFALAGCSESDKVTVPNVTGEDPIGAYDLLHEAGLRVSTSGTVRYALRVREPSGALIIGGLLPNPGVISQTPQPGHTVARSSVIEIEIDGLRGENRVFSCNPYPVRAPNLTGKTLAFISEHESCFSIETGNLPPLKAAGEPHLLDNYVISRQSPAAGESIAPVSGSNPPGYATVTVEVRAVRGE